MADRWIITRHRYKQHETLEAAEAERERLRALLPGEFYLLRIKTSQRPSGAIGRLIDAARALRDWPPNDLKLSEDDSLDSTITNGEMLRYNALVDALAAFDQAPPERDIGAGCPVRSEKRDND